MASFTSSFNSSKLKLAQVNIRSCRNKEVEVSLFLKEESAKLRSLRANVSCVLTCSRANLPCVLFVPTCSRAITTNNKNKFSICFPCIFVIVLSFFFLWNKTVIHVALLLLGGCLWRVLWQTLYNKMVWFLFEHNFESYF